MKKIVALMISLMLCFSMIGAAYAEEIKSRTVIGADLNEAQINSVYASFGFPRGICPELMLSNAEERSYLEDFVEDSVIGTKSISCVYIELLPQGSGMDVTTSNITWCTPQMYISALATAGITDARIIVASPFEVSGTAALAGVYKAYEDITGSSLDDTAKLVSTQELTITGELADEIGSMDSTSIVNELKLMLDQTKNMSDEEIRAVITAISEKYNVTLTNTQVEQLVSLCRALEKLDPGSLKTRVEDVQETIDKVSDAKTKVVGFVDKLQNAVESLEGIFAKIMSLLEPFME